MNYALSIMTCYSLSVANWINRWRHARGYGVHSPLAYSIMKECVRPDKKYGFYSDAYIDFEYHEDRDGLRNARMAIRLINLIRPQRIWYPNGDKRLCNALKMSFPKIHVSTQKECQKNVDFIISHGNRNPNEMWRQMNDLSECGMVVFGKELETMDGATLIICNKVFTIAIRRVGMDFVSYRI